MGQIRGRFWVEALVATVAGLLVLATVVSRDWIEVVFGWDPDAGSGALEWIIVVGFFAIALSCAWLAAMEWRRFSHSS